MKLSANMLNFLGYAMEKPAHAWVGHETTVGLLTTFGLRAALRNGLLEPSVYRLEPPKDGRPGIPGLPYGASYEGYALTEKGKALGAIGAAMRADRVCDCDPYVRRGQALLDAADTDHLPVT